MTRALRTAIAIALITTAMAVVPARSHTVVRWGYLPTSDGVPLRYTVVLPEEDQRFPVALIWSVYTDGVGPTGAYPPAESPVIARALLEAGYAVLGVNMRGTGCSGGQWDLFQPASDGYDVVEWAARQDWSTGDVGMFGFSAPGISQLLTAATRPPHLRAITPADVSTDFYRDVAYPGGIPNATFTGFWTLGSRPGHAPLSIPFATEQGDPACAATIASRPQPNEGTDFARMAQSPYDDKLWGHYSPERILGDIDVPLLTCQAWQDDQVTSRAAGGWLDYVDHERSWTVFTNGGHGTCDDYTTPYTDLVVRFFERYVRGVDNDFESEPRVQIWHETTHDDAGAANIPGWISTDERWPVDVDPVVLHLGPNGALSRDAAATESTDVYAYPAPSSPMESNEYAPSNDGWKIAPAPGSAVSYTSAPLDADLEVLGPGSVDLWLSSSAPDSDVQVTLTEVRADGQEQYLARGWLRASHRALDTARTTDLRPYHSHLRQDAAPLTPLVPASLRVELSPIGHVFRAGSSIRLWVDAPTSVTGLYGFGFTPTPAVNTVHTGGARPSRLVLGSVPGGRARAPQPACDTVIGEPCRPDPRARA